MDQTIRNKLRGVVTQCRKLLEDSTAQALQGRFGIYAGRKKGAVQIEDEARMAHLTEEDRACRQDILDHLGHIQAIGYKPSEALEQLVREIAFTHLNRLCAYKMMESRGLIREAVSRGLKSQGFFFYLADHPAAEKFHNSGQQDLAYRNFLDWLGGTLSQEIGILFNPNDPANRIYPPQRVLNEVLALINDGELKDIWSQDETIGWVYQYFTPKELRDKARKESQAPRNSYELAFRNQFFTPRYVVEFLTDNTLGRIWYEMRKGKTALKDRCRYLVRRPTEMFLKEGEVAPAEPKDAAEDLSQEELLKQPVYIPHRSKKDPREIKVLDPACGSGHFLLYCFDLLQVIYEEAYDDPDLGKGLRKDYPSLEDLRTAVPAMILKHNLHGIDIDMRATQIAALALWLRCQRTYQELGLKNGERPKITRSNLVCAEPMPGEEDMLQEFTAGIKPRLLGQLVDVVFEKMKLAGEAGSLLKIEDEIKDAVAKARKQWMEVPKSEQQLLFPGLSDPRPKQQELRFDLKGITDKAFLDRAEDEIIAALRQYAEKASNGRGFRRRLFAEDAARGFSFVDVCSKKFDVVLMNPPFGAFIKSSLAYVRDAYPFSKNDIYTAFVERFVTNSGRPLVGAITNRTAFYANSYQPWREEFLLQTTQISCFVDLGEKVMDGATVEAAAYVILAGSSDARSRGLFVRACRPSDRENLLLHAIESYRHASLVADAYVKKISSFRLVKESPFVYWITDGLAEKLQNLPSTEPSAGDIRKGLRTGDNFRFVRTLWEVPNKELTPAISANDPDEERKKSVWVPLVLGGTSRPWYSPLTVALNWRNNGAELREYVLKYGSESRLIQAESYYFRPGVSWTGRATRFVPYIVPGGAIPTGSRPMFFPASGLEHAFLVIASTNVASAMMRFYAEKIVWPKFLEGKVKLLPWPDVSSEDAAKMQQFAREKVNAIRKYLSTVEPYHEFRCPCLDSSELGSRQPVFNEVQLLSDEMEAFVTSKYGLTEAEQLLLCRELMQALSLKGAGGEPTDGDDDQDADKEDASEAADNAWTISPGEANISYAIGSIFGRWDIRFATGERQPPDLPDPFDPLPVCPPGMLQGPDGLPAKHEDVPPDYPIRIDWDGILADDPGHEDDIIRRVRDVMEVIWKDRAEAIERDACEILGVRELRDYFRKPGNGGFWMDHVKRYSKSRRKAPIYWYLRSAKGNYGLWLYYHRLDKDILFKALLNYVEPKIRLEEDRLKSLRGRKEAAGSSGREGKQIEKDLDRQDQLVSELHDFADKLRRAANLNLEPDLNDGVVITIAPLFELVPWKEAKEYWENLVEGKYEWSSIGKQMREKGLVKI